MSHIEDKDKWLMRSKDVVLIVGALVGLLAGVGKVYVIAEAVNLMIIRMDKIEPVLANHEIKLALSDERWLQLQRQIEVMSRKLDNRSSSSERGGRRE